MLGIVNGEIVKVTDNVQKEIDINTEVLGIVKIVKVTDDNVQKEIDKTVQ